MSQVFSNQLVVRWFSGQCSRLVPSSTEFGSHVSHYSIIRFDAKFDSQYKPLQLFLMPLTLRSRTLQVFSIRKNIFFLDEKKCNNLFIDVLDFI